MHIADIFKRAKSKVTHKKYYHGSVADIKDDYLCPREQFNHVQDGVVTAVFVTTNFDYAKFFPINRCIGTGHCRLDGKKIFLEKLRADIKPVFYVYTLYETPDNHFVLDPGSETEFCSTKPIKIAKREKFNTAQEIKKLGYEIYVLDEPLKSKVDKKSGNNFAMQQEMDEAIKQKKFHRVDIAGMIAQQKKQKIAPMKKSVERF